MSANNDSTDLQKKKHRSPGYPVIPIDEAIDRVRQIYRQDKRAFTTFEAITQHMGFTAKKRSGTTGRVVAALRQYGLLDERGGQFRVSDLGFRLVEMPEESEERAQLVKQAALTPPMFRKILNYYNGELPSDAAIRSHLIFQERFNPDSVATFIRALRQTINVVNPLPEDYTTGEESEEAENPPMGGRPVPQSPPQPQRPSGRPVGMLPLEEQREIMRASAYGAMNTLLNQPTAPSSEGLNFQVSENSINVTFNGTVTQEIIRKLIKHLEINIEDFPTRAELERTKAKLRRPEPLAASQANADDLDEAFEPNEE